MTCEMAVRRGSILGKVTLTEFSLTNWPLDKISMVVKMTFPNVIPSMKMHEL